MNEASIRVESEQPVYDRHKVIVTMAGLLLIMFLGTLDQTITATALPRIVGDLRDFSLATWVTTVYLIISKLPLLSLSSKKMIL